MSIRGLLVLLPLLLLTACKQQALYSQLTEQEANEIIALMYTAKLPAEKHLVQGQEYSVTTTKEAFSSAMMLLQAYGLPREKFDSLGDVFRKEGFVSSPLEERARLNHALSQEISHTVSSIDGVVMARVHLVVPERMQLDNVVKPSSASVFVKHRPDIDLQNHIGKIKAMVVNGVENLPVENVTVALFPTEPLLMGPSSICLLYTSPSPRDKR